MAFKIKVKGDFILVVVLLLIGAMALIYNQVIVPRRGEATKVVVEIEGQTVGEFELSRDMGPLRFESKYGYNIVEIKDGKVRVTEANCPDLICVHTGWRQHVGQVIACMPHHLVVRVLGESSDPAELDSFTY